MESFKPHSTNTIAATATSQSRTLPATVGSGAWYYNADAANIAYVMTGPSTVTAVAPGVSAAVGVETNPTPIPPGQRIYLTHRDSSDSHWCAICDATKTATVYCSTGIEG